MSPAMKKEMKGSESISPISPEINIKIIDKKDQTATPKHNE